MLGTSVSASIRGFALTRLALALLVTALFSSPALSKEGAWLEEPSSEAVFTSPANIEIKVSVISNNDPVTRLEYYAGTTLIGVDTTQGSGSTRNYRFVWSNVAAGDYKLNIRATTASGELYQATGGAVPIKVVAENAVQTFSKQLVRGWNMVSFPLETVNTNFEMSKVFSSLAGQYAKILTWNPHSQKYSEHNPFATYSYVEARAGMGFWIEMITDGMLTVRGIPTHKDVEIVPGWNLVGFNSMSPMLVTDLLRSIEGKHSGIFTWDPATRAYIGHNSRHTGLTICEPGKGYFIHAKESGLLVFPAP
jgi:hypothetical protein